MNYNNKFNSNHARGLVEFRQNEVPLSARSLNFVLSLYEAYFACRKNKRKTHNQVAFELNYPHNLMMLARELETCDYVPRRSIAFVITKPKVREVMASSFRDRVVQTYYVSRLSPLVDKTINAHSYSCRTGKGGLAAIENLYEGIFEVSKGYKKDCWVAKIDLRNFFYSIDKTLIVRELCEFISNNYKGQEKDLLLHLTEVIYYNLPQEHCVFKAQPFEWQGVANEKSLFRTEWDRGIAIGNLTAQFVANIVTSRYLDYIETSGWRVTHYTDDTAIVIDDKERFLAYMPLIRAKIKERGVTMSDNKFYLQHYTKKVPFLAWEIRKECMLPSKRLTHNVSNTVRLYNIYSKQAGYKASNAENYCSRLNSYFGLLIHSHSYELRKALAAEVKKCWGDVLKVNDDYSKFTVVSGYKEIDKKVKQIKNYRKWINS